MLVSRKIVLIGIVFVLLVFLGLFTLFARRAAKPLFPSALFFQEPKKTESSLDMRVTPPLKTEEVYSIVPVSGGVVDRFGIAQCAVSSATNPCGTIQLNTGARVNSTDATAPTHAPAWLVMQVQTTEPINTLRFNWRFTTGGEGLLRAFVNDDMVSEIDQRHVPAVSSEPEGTYIRDLAPGTHKIAFRLDGYGANPSGVELTGIELGWETIKIVR